MILKNMIGDENKSKIVIKNGHVNVIINVTLEYSKLLSLQRTCILTTDKENILQIVESQAHLRIVIVHIIQRYYRNTELVLDDVYISLKAIFAYYYDYCNHRIALTSWMYDSSDSDSDSDSDKDNVNNSERKKNKEIMNKYKYMIVHESCHTMCKLIVRESQMFKKYKFKAKTERYTTNIKQDI